jgi:hypothetical protein
LKRKEETRERHEIRGYKSGKCPEQRKFLADGFDKEEAAGGLERKPEKLVVTIFCFSFLNILIQILFQGASLFLVLGTTGLPK